MSSWTKRYELRRTRSRSSCEASLSSSESNSSFVSGSAHICFDPEGEWFQGTLSASQRGMFSMQGSRMRKAHSKLGLSPLEDEGFSSPACFSDEESTSGLPDRAEMRGSDDSLVDMEMQESRRKLDENSLNSELYSVLVTDFDTGVTYTVSDVSVALSNLEHCHISSEQLEFRSKRSFKGNQADRVLMKEFSPRHTEKQLLLFEGELSFRYTEPMCHAIQSIEHSKWCL